MITPCTICNKRHYNNGNSIAVIRCVVCDKPRCITKQFLGLLKTCGSKDCMKIRRSRMSAHRTEESIARQSAYAKAHNFGIWMTGRTNHHSKEAKHMFSERWKGAGNPRWKGGVTRSESHSKWMKANPQRVNHYSRIRKAWRRGAEGSYTLGEWLALKRGYLFTCPSCVKSEPEIKLTVDHIVPIKKGGSTDITNIQPLCGHCNGSKRVQIKKFDTAPIVAKFKAIIAA
jgi:5-methylcytosine-specific restriction endonuclease McrA